MSNANDNAASKPPGSVNPASSHAERTLLGNDISDDDEQHRPPSDRSPLTRRSVSESDR